MPLSSQSSLQWEGKHLRVLKSGHWEFVERIHATGAVVIAAVTDEGDLILTEQHRPPVSNRVIELPAGLAGDIAGHETEELAAAARRELLEETGYEAREMIWLAAGPPSAGLSSEIVNFFRATGLRCAGAGGGDDHEDIQIHKIPLRGVRDWLVQRVAEGLLVDPKVYVGLYFITPVDPKH
jgi:ADP-ribose pyrophosphatase